MTDPSPASEPVDTSLPRTAALTQSDIDTILAPLRDRKHTWRLFDYLIAVLVAVSLTIGGLGLITARNTAASNERLTEVLAKRSPTIEHLACVERRAALVSRRTGDVNREANRRTEAFDILVRDLVQAAASVDFIEAITSEQIVEDTEDLNEALIAVQVAQAELDAAQASLDAANDPAAPDPIDFLESLEPLALTRCPAFPQLQGKTGG